MKRTILAAALSLVALWAGAWVLSPAASARSTVQDKPFGFALPGSAQDKHKFASAAGCATKDCHGAEAPKGSPALNEYGIWKAQDPHSKTFTTLYKAPSRAMGQKMGIAKVHESPKCLSCHSKIVPADQVMPGAKWSMPNGVSCEVCHGPAEKWLMPHATPKEKNWHHEQSVATGMIDLRDLPTWAASCAGCHLQIEHDTVAAGHPRLHFELVDYNARTGAHWKTEKHPSMAPDFDRRAWTIGQAVSFAESLRNLGRHLKDGAKEDLTKLARDQAAAYALMLKHVGGFTPAEIPADPAKLEEMAAAVQAQLKTLVPADDSTLAKIAAEEAPKEFSGARQALLAFRALSKKAEAKAEIDALFETVAAKNEAKFDAAKFAAAYDALRAKFK